MEEALRIERDELYGLQVDFRFGRELLHNPGQGFKLQPTAPGIPFSPNPPAGEPGIYANELTIWVRPGMTQTRIDTLFAGIQAEVVYQPLLSDAWRIKLPPQVNLEQAIEYLEANSDAQVLMPAVTFADQDAENWPWPEDNINPDHIEGTNARAAWEELAGGDTESPNPAGSFATKVAIVGHGVDMAHPDLYRNIWINQQEIPSKFRAGGELALEDVDDDGLITFHDLNDPANWRDCPMASSNTCTEALRGTTPCDLTDPVCDWNCNGYIDAGDLKLVDQQQNWHDGIDGTLNAQGQPVGQNGVVDDLHGLHLGSPANLPMPEPNQSHETQMASVLAAHHGRYAPPNNPSSMGVAGRASIIVVRAAETGKGKITDAAWYDAVAYVAKVKPSIYVSSVSYVMTTDMLDLTCADLKPETGESESSVRTGVSSKKAGQSINKVLRKIREHNLNSDLEALGFIAAGNNHLFLDDCPDSNLDGICQPDEALPRGENPQGPGTTYVHFPATMMRAAERPLLLVGGLELGTEGFEVDQSSNYGGDIDIWAPYNTRALSNLAGPEAGALGVVDGTSFAAPAAAGVGVLTLERSPELRRAESEDGASALQKSWQLRSALLSSPARLGSAAHTCEVTQQALWNGTVRRAWASGLPPIEP